MAKRKKKAKKKRAAKKDAEAKPEDAPSEPEPERVPKLAQAMEEPPAQTPNEVLRKELGRNPIVARGPDTPTLDKRARNPEREPAHDPNELRAQMPGPDRASMTPDQAKRIRRRAIKRRRSARARENLRLPMTMMRKGQ